MKSIKLLILPIVLIFIVLFSCAYVVREWEQVFITQFGKPVGEPVTEPGIHFKLPFFHKVHAFDRRFLPWDGDPNEVPTKDKKFISIDTYARWRISDPLLFYQNVTDERGAQTRLDDILDGATRSVIAGNDLVEIVRSEKRTQPEDPNSEEAVEISNLNEFSYGRGKIAAEVFERSKPKLGELGIELLDFRFKRINYGPEVQEEIFKRMTSERNRIADKFRSEGSGEASKIQGEQERELKRISSEAYRQAEEIRGQADAEAVAIYAGAYNKSEESREFFQFLKTMESYETSLSEKDSLILSTDTEFYRYLKGSNNRTPQAGNP